MKFDFCPLTNTFSLSYVLYIPHVITWFLLIPFIGPPYGVHNMVLCHRIVLTHSYMSSTKSIRQNNKYKILRCFMGLKWLSLEKLDSRYVFVFCASSFYNKGCQGERWITYSTSNIHLVHNLCKHWLHFQLSEYISCLR